MALLIFDSLLKGCNFGEFFHIHVKRANICWLKKYEYSHKHLLGEKCHHFSHGRWLFHHVSIEYKSHQNLSLVWQAHTKLATAAVQAVECLVVDWTQLTPVPGRLVWYLPHSLSRWFGRSKWTGFYTSYFLLELETHFSLLRVNKFSEELACSSVFSLKSSFRISLENVIIVPSIEYMQPPTAFDIILFLSIHSSPIEYVFCQLMLFVAVLFLIITSSIF